MSRRRYLLIGFIVIILVLVVSLPRSALFIGGDQRAELDANRSGSQIPSEYNVDNIGQFNIPLYFVALKVGDLSHGMNALLVGDKALEYNDWIFIESMTDYIFNSRKFRIPNSTIHICGIEGFVEPSDNNPSGVKYLEILRFNIDDSGIPSVSYYHPDLVLERPGK